VHLNIYAPSQRAYIYPVNHSYGYQMQGNGRWISLNLKKRKKPGGKKAKRPSAPVPIADEDEDDNDAYGMEVDSTTLVPDRRPPPTREIEEDDPDDPEKSIPSARYNAMLAVQRNTLYMFVHKSLRNRRFPSTDSWVMNDAATGAFSSLSHANLRSMISTPFN
jgi:hypothetical protein